MTFLHFSNNLYIDQTFIDKLAYFMHFITFKDKLEYFMQFMTFKQHILHFYYGQVKVSKTYALTIFYLNQTIK